MKQLILMVAIVAVTVLPVYAGPSIVNSLKIPVVQKGVPFEPLLDFQIVKSPVKMKLVDETGMLIEILEKYPKNDYVVVDGAFHVHTKLTETVNSLNDPSISVEGSIETLGFFGYDINKNKYLIKGDYQFNLEYISTKTKTFNIYGTIPIKLIDASNSQDYYIYAAVDIICDAKFGCTDAVIEFVATNDTPIKKELP